ncbi:MAG: DUF202 domain-containing protein [SAR324 cluster bacterium]|nr:DUF202 domain-containing protein [SAR324 cluster bacterium]
MTNPYERFNAEDLILRDELAIDRTLLANERTLLAYLRSGIGLMLAGVTFIQFSQDQWFKMVGIFCIPASIIIIIIGGIRYRSMNSKIMRAKRNSD